MNITRKKYTRPEIAVVELPEFCDTGLGLVQSYRPTSVVLAPHRDRFIDLDEDFDDAWDEAYDEYDGC